MRTERVHATIPCPGEGLTVNISDSDHGIDYDMEMYFDPDLYLSPTSYPSEKVPRLLFTGESFLWSRCFRLAECPQHFNWSYMAASAADIHFHIYRDHWIEKRFNGERARGFDFEREIMEPKRRYRSMLEEKNQKLALPVLAEENSGLYYPIASWMAYNCEEDGFVTSNRKEYVEELMKYMPVHSIGRCLNNVKIEDDTGRFGDTQEYSAKKKVITRYKFYFAFENSMCRGYITEKQLHCFESGTVPVVMAHPDSLILLPRGSYIYVGDFKSAKELADYLIYLDGNDEEYKKYFKWRSNENIIREWGEHFSNVYERHECNIARLYNNWKSGNLIQSKVLSYQSKFQQCLPFDYFHIRGE
eukprot:gene10342-12699_t